MIGEHIRTRRDGRWSHAIDCGDETVIHLADEGTPRVRRSYRPAFLAGADAVEIVTHRERTFPPGEVVARAYSRFADPALAAMFRDSEAFAAWCATGRLPPGTPNLALPALLAPPAAPAPARARASTPEGERKQRKDASRPAARKRAAKARPARRPTARAKAKANARAKRPVAKAKRKAPAPKRGAKPRRSRRR